MKPTTMGAPRILIVDDDEGVLQIVSATLIAVGFGVATAHTAREALSLLDSDEFDLMVTDVMLPGGLNGVELVAYARARRPALKSLFVSGRSEPVTEEPGQDDFVAKPFWPRELLGCVYELLNREPGEGRVSRDYVTAERALVEAKVACLRQRWEGR